MHFLSVSLSHLEPIIDILHSFHFSAIVSALHGLPAFASICFINIQKLDADPLVTLFDRLSIPYFQNFMFLIFKASPVELEKALLAALEFDIVISPSFISSAQKITFEFIDNQLFARLTQATQEHLVALQINRDTIGTLNDVFFTPSFLSFLKLRFLCQDSPQIQTVKNHEGNISNVLTFTSSTLLFDTLPQNQLPFTFQFDNLTFTLSHLEPLFIIKPKSLVPYPYETQQEHFQRFTSDHESLASRIPLLTPHPNKGGPSANNLILSITVSSLPLSQPKITYLSPPTPSPFYIFLAPLPHDWTASLIQFFPNQTLDFTEIPLTELPISIIIEPVSTPFPIPAFHFQPPSLSSFGWINVSSFTSAKVLYLVSSHAHLNLLYHFLQDHAHLFSTKVTIGQASCIDLASPSHTPPRSLSLRIAT